MKTGFFQENKVSILNFLVNVYMLLWIIVGYIYLDVSTNTTIDLILQVGMAEQGGRSLLIAFLYALVLLIYFSGVVLMQVTVISQPCVPYLGLYSSLILLI